MKSARRMASIGTLTACAVFAGSILVPTMFAGPAAAADNGAWSASPTSKGQLAPRQFFFVEAAGGQTLRDSVTIKNFTSEPLRLDLFPSDAYNVPQGGGFAVTGIDEETDDVGSWITLDRSVVVVPEAGLDKNGDVEPGAVDVGFRMTVPVGASPGDHAGGITTLEAAPPVVGEDSQVRVRRQLSVRTYVRVAGPLTPNLQVEQVTLEATPARLPFVGRQGGARVTYVIRNAGNTRITPGRELTLTGLFGRTLHQAPPGSTPEILAGSRVILSEDFQGMPVLDRVTARVVLTTEQLEEPVAGDTTRWVISLPFLVLLLLLFGAIAAAIRLSRRRTRDDDDLDVDMLLAEEPR